MRCFPTVFCLAMALACPRLFAAQSNLSLTGTAQPRASSNELFSVNLTVTNLGPGSASDVVITNWLPTGANVFSATATTGTIATNGSHVKFSLGTLANGAGAKVELKLFSGTVGMSTNRAETSSSSNDPQPANNAATNVIVVASFYFKQAGSLNIARQWHSATLLQNGKVLIVGGNTPFGNTLKAELFDPVTGTFAFTGDAVGDRVFSSSTTLQDGRVLVVGNLPSCEIYNPATGVFSTGPGMINWRSRETSSLLNDGRVLVTGGYGTEKKAEVFNPATGAWSALPDLIFNSLAHSAVTLPNGDVVLTRGIAGATQAQMFLAGSNLFVPAGNFNWSRMNSAVVALTNNTVLLAGGYDGLGGSPFMWNAEIYNPATQQSTAAGSLNSPRWNFTGTLLLDGRVLLAGGAANYTPQGYYIVNNTTEIFDPLTPSLTPGPLLNHARRGHTATRLQDGRVLLTGGTDQAGSILSSAEIYDPSTALAPPLVSIFSSSGVEGNSGTNSLTFDVALSKPMGVPVTVTYRTRNGSAVGGSDFEAVAIGSIQFPPGTTNQSIVIPHFGETVFEEDEFYDVELLGATNAVIAISTAPGFLLNDDPIPTITAFNAGVAESDSGSTQMVFSIVLSNPSHQPVQVSCLSTNITAIKGEDYGLYWMIFTFPPLTTNQTASVTVFGDITVEPDETFGLALFDPVNAVLGTTQAIGTIINDDGVPGKIHHFEFDAITSPKYGAVPFSATLRARDISNAFSGFNGVASIRVLSNNVPVATAVTPTVVQLTNGVWTGQVTIAAQGSSFAIEASHVFGYVGVSNPFILAPSVDMATWSETFGPTPRSFAPFEILAWAQNSGLSPATGVILTNILPPEFTLLSAENSGGSWTNFGNIVVATFTNSVQGPGVLLRMQVKAGPTGFFTNRTFVSAHEFDPQPANNSASTAIQVQPPRLSVTGSSVIENPAGTNAIVTFSLSSSNNLPVSAGYYTVPMNAMPGLDYVETNGSVLFPPGVRTQTVAIAILDDALDESDNQFRVEMQSLVNAVSGSPAAGIVTILDDDPEPFVTIHNSAAPEGDGVGGIGVNVSLSPASEKAVTVFYATAPGTATSGVDFIGTSGYVQFTQGQTNWSIPITILGNTINEPDETFFVNITSVQNAALVNTQAVATILNDDAVPGRHDHFVFDPIPSVRVIGRPFNVTIRAVDFSGAPATNVNVAAQLSAPNEFNAGIGIVTPSVASNFVGGVWTGTAVIHNLYTNVALRASDPAGHVGDSNPFRTIQVIPGAVVVPAAATEGNGLLPNAAMLSVQYSNDVDVVFTASSSSTNDILVPSTVVLPAGATNVAFDLTVVDDGLVDGSAPVTVEASAAGYNLLSGTMRVHDNETATLSISVTNSAVEKSSPLVARLTIDPPPDANVIVAFSSSDTTELQVSPALVWSLGQTSLFFNVNIVDDTLMDGAQTATITAHVENWTDGVASIVVHDNESTNITITPIRFENLVREGMGTLTNAMRVIFGGTATSNITVNLASSDTTELIVPTTVVLTNGGLFVGFNVIIPDDNLFDGIQTVSVVASAPGFRPATNTVSIHDNDVHHLEIGTISSPKQGEVSFNVSVTARDINNSLMSGLCYITNVTAAGDHGPVDLTTSLSPVGNGVVTVTIRSWDTNVRLTVTDTNGLVVVSNPFDVSPPAIHRLNLAATSLAFDSIGGRLYVTINSNSIPSHCIVAIDPVTGKILDSYPIGLSPDRIVIGDAGQFAYVSVPASNSIRRFNIATESVDLEIPLGAGLTAEDIAVQPGNPGVIAVSRRNFALTPRFHDVVIFDNGVPRANVVNSNVTLANSIEFGTAGRLYGKNREEFPWQFARMNVDAGGVTLDTQQPVWSTVTDFKVAGGRIYWENGAIEDAETFQHFGTFNTFNEMCPDLGTGRTFFFYWSSVSSYQLHAGTSPPNSAGSIFITNISIPSNPTRVGDAGLAFRSGEVQVLIVRSPLITDTDSDNMPDSWELQYFGGLNTAAGTPDSDFDNDGHSNLQELRAGTNPTNSLDHLRFAAASLLPGGIEIGFPSVIGRRYQIERATNLPPVWQVIRSNLTGSGASTVVVPIGGNPQEFYRLRVQ